MSTPFVNDVDTGAEEAFTGVRPADERREVRVLAGESVLLGAAMAYAASSARTAHSPTENMRVRLAPFGANRRDVPLLDHGRRSGAARTERPFDWRRL